MKKDLFLFTSEFPFGNNETFVKNEILVLSEKFQNIYLVPNTKPKAPNKASLPSNVNVIELFEMKSSFKKKLSLMFLNSYFIITCLLNEVLKSRQKLLALKNLKNNFHLLVSLLFKAEMLKAKIQSNNCVFYTFWFSTDATLLSILSKKKIINGYFSRAHGFDLYEDNGKENYIPFRNFQLSLVNTVFCVSKVGMKYLADLYPQFSQKIKSSYLGVFDNGANIGPGDDEIVIVSCSNIVPVKRLNLIVDALKSVRINVKWVHFGSGYLKQKLDDEIALLPNNIKVEMRGQVENEEIINFYQNNSVSVLLNTSISEGLPVSMMESISFGIPIIATNVGGVSEIVNEQTGVLLDVNFQSKQLADLLNDFNNSKLNSVEFRKKIKQFYCDKFSAKVNYQEFASLLYN